MPSGIAPLALKGGDGMTRTINPDGTLTMNLNLFEKLFGIYLILKK